MNLLPFIFVLFCLGIFCILTRRNLVKILIGLVLLGKACALSLIWAGVIQQTVAYTQSLVLVVIVIEVMVVAFFLSMIYAFYQQSTTLNIDELRRLKG